MIKVFRQALSGRLSKTQMKKPTRPAILQMQQSKLSKVGVSIASVVSLPSTDCHVVDMLVSRGLAEEVGGKDGPTRAFSNLMQGINSTITIVRGVHGKPLEDRMAMLLIQRRRS